MHTMPYAKRLVRNRWIIRVNDYGCIAAVIVIECVSLLHPSPSASTVLNPLHVRGRIVTEVGVDRGEPEAENAIGCGSAQDTVCAT
jgi:hypothetical protein